MGQKAADDVVAQGAHVTGGGLGDEGRDVAEVPDEESRQRAVHALAGQDCPDPHRGEVVAGDSDPCRPCEQEQEWQCEHKADYAQCHAGLVPFAAASAQWQLALGTLHVYITITRSCGTCQCATNKRLASQVCSVSWSIFHSRFSPFVRPIREFHIRIQYRKLNTMPVFPTKL